MALCERMMAGVDRKTLSPLLPSFSSQDAFRGTKLSKCFYITPARGRKGEGGRKNCHSCLSGGITRRGVQNLYSSRGVVADMVNENGVKERLCDVKGPKKVCNNESQFILSCPLPKRPIPWPKDFQPDRAAISRFTAAQISATLGREMGGRNDGPARL